MPDDEGDGQSFQLPLVLTGLNDQPIIFANWMAVTHAGSEFVLTIGQYSQPIAPGSPEEVVRRTGAVPIKVVGRFGIPASRMVDMVRALSENLSKYEQKRE